jgi:hypothetical protein
MHRSKPSADGTLSGTCRQRPWRAGEPPRHRPSRQRGLSFGGIMIGLVLVVFFANLAITMIPAYATFWQVRSIMDRLAEQPQILSEGARGVLRSLGSQLQVNGIRDLKAADFALEPVAGGTELALAYEVRKHLFFNVDVVMAFRHEVVLDKP